MSTTDRTDDLVLLPSLEATPETVRVIGHEFFDDAAAQDHATVCRALGLRAWAGDGIVAVVVSSTADVIAVRAHALACGGIATGL